jgi:membrane protein
MASTMRSALSHIFGVPRRERRNFALGKLFDLATIAVVGVIMVVSVSLSAAVTSQTGRLLRAIGIEHSPVLRVLLSALGVLLGVATSSLMLFVLYRVLPDSHLPSRNLWAGALVAAFGLELLKLLATFVIARVTSNPLYGTFAIVVALLVWINYFARLAMLGAAVAVTRNRLTERDLVASEAFAARAGQLARTPIGVRRVASGLLAAIMLLVVVGRRSVRTAGSDAGAAAERSGARHG